MFDSKYIAMYNDFEIRDITQEDCKKSCQTHTGFSCKTVEYNKRIRRCYLSKLSFAGAKKLGKIRTQKDFVLYTMCESSEGKSYSSFTSFDLFL